MTGHTTCLCGNKSCKTCHPLVRLICESSVLVNCVLRIVRLGEQCRTCHPLNSAPVRTVQDVRPACECSGYEEDSRAWRRWEQARIGE
eukprot:scaffold213272_cov17-Tisochrysis_lutea.AAC.1